ncbi:Sister chromatid cohesion protein 2 [Actinomortierella ambigua]|uniref:Sister chromatid cohesion protein n=1 Tax=Actinomortierella ambigua TaxID=1343610 RepID=A0A9P6UD28_9FUNG|nr:Sister chromatid cohesion protein 2 [Actinomortierella ambigua]
MSLQGALPDPPHASGGFDPAFPDVEPSMAPTSPQSGMQYSALASLITTGGMLQGMPSPGASLPEFKLVDTKDKTVRRMLKQKSLDRESRKHQVDFLRRIVDSVQVNGILFPPANQTTAHHEDLFKPTQLRGLSRLSAAVIDHPVNPRRLLSPLQPRADSIYQLPVEDPLVSLYRMKLQMDALSHSLPTPSHMTYPMAKPLSLPLSPSTPTTNTTATHIAPACNHVVDQRDAHSWESPTSALSSSSHTKQAQTNSEAAPHARQKRQAADESDHEKERTAGVKRTKAATNAPSRSGLSTRPEGDHTSVANTPSSSREDSSLPDSNPVIEFENTIKGLLDDSIETEQPVRLSVVDLRNISRLINQLNSKSLVGEVQMDDFSRLLKYLESFVSDPESSRCFPLDNDGDGNDMQDASGDELDSRIATAFDNTMLVIEHLALAVLILNNQDIPQHIYPEELLINSLDVFKSIADKMLVPALEFSKDVAAHARGFRVFTTMVGSQAHRQRMLSFVSTACHLSHNLAQLSETDIADSVVVKLVYLALALFFIDTTANMMVGPVETESLKLSGTNLLRQLADLLKPASESAHASMTYVFKFLLSRSMKSSKSSIEADYRTALDSLVTDLLVVLGHPEWPVAEQCLYIYSTSMVRFIDDAKSELNTRTMAVDSLGMVAAKIKTTMLRCKNSTLASHLKHQALQNEDVEGREKMANEEWRLFYGELGKGTNINDLISLQGSYNQVIDYLQPLEWNDRAIRAAKCAWVWQWANLLCSACSASKDIQGTDWPQDKWGIISDETMKLWRILAGHPLPQARRRVARTLPLEASEYLTSRQPLFQSFDLLLSRILMTLEGGVVALRTKSLKSLSLIVTGDYGVLSQQNVQKTISLRLQDSSPAVRDAAIDLVGKYMLEDKDILKAYYEIVGDRLSDTGLGVRKRVIRLFKDIFAKTETRAVKNDIAKRILWRVKDDEPTVRDLAIKSAFDIWFGEFVQATQPVLSNAKLDEEPSNVAQESPLSTVSTSQRRVVLRRGRVLVDAVEQLPPPLVDAFGHVLVTLLGKEGAITATPHSASAANAPMSSQAFSRVCYILVDCLVDLIVVLQEEEEATSKAGTIATMHALSIFSKAEPRLMTARHLATLRTYLVGASTADDWRITMHVLKIYLDVVPAVQETTSLAFAQSVEKLLSSLLSSCPLVVVPDAARALCLVIRLVTLQSARLSKLIQSCVGMLRSDLERFHRQGTQMTENKTRRLLLITGLLCQHFPFDKEIEKHPEEQHLATLASNMAPSVHETVFNTLLSYFSKDLPVAIQQTALRCVGYVFHSFPTLMNTQQGIELMDSVFEERSPAHLHELLQHFNNYLIKTNTFESEADAHSSATAASGHSSKRGGGKRSHSDAAAGSGKATRSLIAKAEDHLEAGIASAVMQRYLDRILQCTLMLDPTVQVIAVDVMTIINQQALVHPMLCMPSIVALETSPNRVLSDRVLRIHKDLHHKHASLIYAKSLECIRTMYLYQKQLQSSSGEHEVQGYRAAEGRIPESLLNPMYSLVSEKRQVRQSLLLGLVKLLDVEPSNPTSTVDPIYIRFLGELLATLEYRTVEEVLYVIFYLNRIIAGAGFTLLESLREQRDPSSTCNSIGIHLSLSSGTMGSSLPMASSSMDKGMAPAPSKRSKRRKKKGISNDAMVTSSSHQRSSLLDHDESGEDEVGDRVLLDWYSNIPEATFRSMERTARGSIALETVVLVKSHLKHVYDISESRCQQFQPSAHAGHKERPHAIHATPGKLPWNRTRLGIQMLVMNDLSTISSNSTTTTNSSSAGGDKSDDGVATLAHTRARKMRAIDIQLARFRRLMEAESVDKMFESLEIRSERNSSGPRNASISIELTTRIDPEPAGGLTASGAMSGDDDGLHGHASGEDEA